MKSSLTRWGTAALMALAMAGCGSDGGDSTPVAPPLGTSVAAAISAAAAVPANDSATNSSSAFTVVQGAGVTAVTVNSPPKVNFSVFSDGKVVSSIPIGSVSFAIAKLIPGTNGDPDQWVNYVYRKETAATPYLSNSVPSGTTATQATTDGKMTADELTKAGLPAQLVYNPDGYYTYSFRADIKDPNWKAPDGSTFTNGTTFDPSRTHRVVIQLAYKNAAGETVLVNPYVDFTLDAAGKSVFVTDPSKTRKMADVASCNGCHDKLALHGGGRVDTQYCVMCHNPGTTDANSGNVLTMATMVHKIHSGRLLAGAVGGEDYVIWGYQNSKHDYAEVGFPQDLRNCSKCHSASNPNTPQGDNWKKVVSREACLTCHANNAGSDWDTSHQKYARLPLPDGTGNAAAKAKDLTNAQCANCHKAGSGITSDRVHWNQNEENAAKYKMNIENVTYTPSATTGGTSTVTVKYFVSDPTNGNAAYKLIANQADCTFATNGTLTNCNNTKFGNLKFYLAYQNMKGQSAAVTEWSAYNNGGNSAVACLYEGPTWSSCPRTAVNDGSNHYTATITVPADGTYTAAFGNARVVSIGQIKEVKLQVKSPADPRLPDPDAVYPADYVNTLVQHTYMDVVLSGASQPRRQIVSNEKCNVCHGALGATSGSNTLANAFHGGARNTVEACVICHDANRSSSGNLMTNGLNVYEPYQMKRMIHGIHGNSKRLYPFTHGNKVVGAFCNPANPLSKSPVCDPKLVLATTGVENYAAEVAYPSVGLNCDACHVNGSWKQDLGTLGAVSFKPSIAAGTTTLVTDPNEWLVISPKAASCTACHDSSFAMGHVRSLGGSSFNDFSQKQVAGLPRETCNDCHSPGAVKGVDVVHGQK